MKKGKIKELKVWSEEGKRKLGNYEGWMEYRWITS